MPAAQKVINVRFGDPETQPVMLRLQSDLVELVEAAIDGRLDEVEAQWDARPSLGVVLAARPYPEAPITGDVISGLDDVPASARCSMPVRHWMRRATWSVRAVACCAWPHWRQRARRAGQCLCRRGQVRLANAFHHNDIGWRAIAREVRHTPLPCMARIEYQ